jgi:amino acid permease
VPSFVNELSRSVSIHKTIIYPILVCIAFYILIGLAGAASFPINSSTDILATLSASDQNKVLVTIVNILFPIAVLVTSVPVFAIVIRYNLVRGNFCSNRKYNPFDWYDDETQMNQVMPLCGPVLCHGSSSSPFKQEYSRLRLYNYSGTPS